MSMAMRKLQAEVDKTLKAITLGVETFDSTFAKLDHATNSTQRNKIEDDLKTQIKKLQRLRDQIKAWLGNNDIKDKNPLIENRKLIESQMERFKALEKEMKMKAYSKEGLIAQSQLAPAEKHKREIIDWIGTTTEELSRQIEQTEAEVEQLGTGGGKKTKKAQGDRLNELEELNERRQWHIGRMEVVQRMLENGQLEPEQVEAIQEDVNYFVEANTEEDFDYDQGIYDELNLQDEEDYNPDLLHNDELSNLDSASIADTNIETSSVIAPPPKTPMKEEKEKKATPVRSTSISIPSTSDDLPPQPPSPIAPKKTVSRKTTQDVKSAAVSSLAEVKTPAKSTPQSEAVPAPKAAPLPPIRYAAAAAAAVAATVAATVPNIPGPSATNADSIGSPVSKKMEPPMSTLGLDGPEQSSSQMVQSPETAPAPVKESAPQTNGHAPPPPPGLVQSPAPDAQEASHAAAPSLQAQNAISPQPTAGSAPPGYQLSLPPIAPAPHAESSRAGSGYSATSPRPPPQGVLGNLMQSFDVAKELSERRGNDINELHSALDASYANAPHQIDAEPPRYYHPKNPIKTPSYYPQTRPPILEDKTIYQRLDMDQLFYIFYYVTGGYEQWLAAQELKRQSWRFHKQYLTWFQRAHNPQAITEDYEQGGYYYFDWENSWCQRKKSDFRFEYRWLSDH